MLGRYAESMLLILEAYNTSNFRALVEEVITQNVLADLLDATIAKLEDCNSGNATVRHRLSALKHRKAML